MKRFWIGIALLFISISLCVIEHNLTISMSEDIKNYLNKVTVATENKDYNLAIDLNKQLNTSWQNFKKPMSIFISHDILNDVTENLNILETELLNEDSSFCTNSTRVKTQIDSIEENEKISLGNVL